MARPTLYQAWMDVKPVAQRAGDAVTYDLVGPVCESGDWLARDRALAVEPGDVLAMMAAGAYGFTMASNYNTRGRAAEVLVDGDQVHVIRKRENPADLFALETIVK
jgi:diaminopimelate decarboxylase